MPRIIQDSDDSDDAAEEPLNALTVDYDIISTISTALASTEGRRDEQGHPENSSDKAIRKELESAHRALFEPTPSVKRSAVDSMETLSSQSARKQNKLKRTKTTGGPLDTDVDGEAQKEGRAMKRRKSMQTYGSQTSRNGFGEVWDVPSSGGENPAAGLGVVHVQEKETLIHAHTAVGLSSTADEMGSVGFLTHDPNELFPDSVSTAESRGRRSQVVEVEVGGVVEERMQDHRVVVQIPEPQARQEPKETFTEEETQMGSIFGRVAVPQDDDIEQEMIDAPHNVGRGASNEDTENTTTQSERALEIKEDSVLPACTTPEDVKDSTHTTIEDRQNRKKAQTREYTDEANEDELTVGLPKEMYQPRPSKSRGSRVPADVKPPNAPNSSKPAKSRLRRHKTTGAISAYSSSLREMGFRSSQVEVALADANGNFDEALETLTSRNDSLFGAQQSVSQKLEESKMFKIAEEDEPEDEDVSKRKHEDLEKQMVEEEGEPVIEPVIKSKAAKRTRGRPRKQEILITHDGDDAEEEETVVPRVADLSDEEVVEPKRKGRGRVKTLGVPIDNDDFEEEPLQVGDISDEDAPVAPVLELKKKGRGRTKKQEVVVDDDEAEEEALQVADVSDEDAPITPIAQPKKKGRGRPKKGQKLTEGGIQEDNSNEPSMNNDGALRARDPNQPAKSTTRSNNEDEHGYDQENKPAATPPDDDAMKQNPAPAKTTPEKTSTPASARLHSPLKIARVPLKVGLSRRARIEPLLRIVRK